MKKTLLIGLAAVALGSMTACSNILEEEGTISAKTGIVSFNLTSDPTIEIVTKANEVAIPTGKEGDFKVTIDGNKDYIVSYSAEKGFSQELFYEVYNVVAHNTELTEDEPIAWNKPYFVSESTSLNVDSETKTLPLVCKRGDAVISIDKSGLTSNGFTNISLTAKTESTAAVNALAKENNASQKWFEQDQLCVKAGTVVKMNLSMSVDGETKKFSFDLLQNSAAVVAGNQYNVTFTVNKGEATFTIKVNDTLNSVTTSITIDPYQN